MDRDDRIEEIRRRKKRELSENEEKSEENAQQNQQETKKDELLRMHLTSGARRRLNTVEMSNPSFAKRVEQQLLTLIQSGRITQRISEEEMKEILTELKNDDGYNIRRR